jgi:hypothetical protein
MTTLEKLDKAQTLAVNIERMVREFRSARADLVEAGVELNHADPTEAVRGHLEEATTEIVWKFREERDETDPGFVGGVDPMW